MIPQKPFPKAIAASFAMLFAFPAIAEEGHFTLPPNAPSVVTDGNASGFTSIGEVPSCNNKPALLAYYQNYRKRARQGYANLIAKMIPSVVRGTKCINAKEAFDAKYEPNGDYFVLTCLAETKGKLTHLYKMELLVEPEECLSDRTIHNFINSPQCQIPGEARNFVTYHLAPCPITKPNEPPRLRGAGSAYPIDPDYFSRLMNDRPSIQNIVDEDRRVKGGRMNGPDSGSSGDACNAAGCLPGVSNSRDVK